MRDCDLSSHAPKGPSWAARFHPSIEMCDDGLVFGGGSHLMRMTGAGPKRLALDDDRARVLALLSVVYRRPVGADVLIHLEAVSAHWQRGDKALANLRLVFAGLPRLEDPADAARLRLAGYCLDEGLSPRALMIELGLDPSALDVVKTYDPEEPGDWRGRWARDQDRGASASRSRPDGRIVVAVNDKPHQPPGVPIKESADAEETYLGENDPYAVEIGPIVPLLPHPAGGLPVDGEFSPPEASPANPPQTTLDQLSAIATQAAGSVAPGSGPGYGTAVHKAFSDTIKGLGDPNLNAEESYLNGGYVIYGTPGAVRLDAVEGPVDNPTAIFDLKTGAATLTPSRIRRIRSHLPIENQDIPILEVRP